ncbi:CoA-binding protein [Natrarchaeobaculum aegyptiacum]|uniref:acetate--CoA ligase (ADP-forming) n=1 Tax=Natrarchaeobaculum aegyptiacum TaxID=745377 RepID=A0A2Z2HUT4_9EURY|nr:CoA-binding protein [Natrarchaeobaculum aegyptiacum]ARS90543.1 CoA-binding protein [Natrarchaeobaculum aegyptiacum]
MPAKSLFDPSGIAVVGASKTPGKIGYEAMQNAIRFDGPVYPVNPSAEGTVMDREFVSSVTEIDGPVDLALCCVPAPIVPDVIDECAEAGIGGAVIFAGGFAEAGPEGQQLQDRIVETALEGDVSVLGPNTSGFLVPGSDLHATFATDVEHVPAGNVAIVAQSGGLAYALAFRSENEDRGVSAMVGLGNRATVGFEEAIEYFDGDEATDAIVLHVEGSDDARSLLETCEAVDTPIVAYNVGEHDVGEFAESHTGALTGSYELYEAGFAQYGVPTVGSSQELLDAGNALADCPEPDGPNVGVVTAQAGPGIAIADRLQALGATLPDLTPETQEVVEEILPGITFSDNPVDTGRPMPEFGDVVTAVAEDENVDVVLVYELYEAALGYPTDAVETVVEDLEVPIVFGTAGPNEVLEEEVAELEALGVPTFRTPERAADAVGGLVQYARRNRKPRTAAEETEVSR